MLSASSRGFGEGGGSMSRGDARAPQRATSQHSLPPAPASACPPSPRLCGALNRRLDPGFLLLFQKTIPQEILPARYLCGSHTDLAT